MASEGNWLLLNNEPSWVIFIVRWRCCKIISTLNGNFVAIHSVLKQRWVVICVLLDLLSELYRIKQIKVISTWTNTVMRHSFEKNSQVVSYQNVHDFALYTLGFLIVSFRQAVSNYFTYSCAVSNYFTFSNTCSNCITYRHGVSNYITYRCAVSTL